MDTQMAVEAAGKNDLEGPQRQDFQSVTQKEKVEEDVISHDTQDHRATFTDPPIRPIEKRRVLPSRSFLIPDKLVRPPRSRTPNDNWKSALPSSPPFLRCSTNLL